MIVVFQEQESDRGDMLERKSRTGTGSQTAHDGRRMDRTGACATLYTCVLPYVPIRNVRSLQVLNFESVLELSENIFIQHNQNPAAKK